VVVGCTRDKELLDDRLAATGQCSAIAALASAAATPMLGLGRCQFGET
jgi:hypothetical protein